MTRRDGMRERWITAVLRTQNLNPSDKLVCIALSRYMDDRGRVGVNRAIIAADLGWDTKQRVTDRIKKAKDEMFLCFVRGGKNGLPAVYDAMIPASEVPRGGVPGRGAGNGKRGTSNGVPQIAPEPVENGGQVPQGGVPIRARARARYLHKPPITPAHDGSREERDHLQQVGSIDDAASLADWRINAAVPNHARRANP